MARSFAPVVGTSEVFESYEADFLRLRAKAQERAAAALASTVPPRSRASALREAAEAERKADQALQQMELEAKSLGALSASIAPKIRGYRGELASARRQLRDAESALQREGLLGAGGSGREMEDKTLQDTHNRLRGASRRLEDTKRTALEAEEIGLDIMSDLQSQRETIYRTKAHLHDVDGNLDLSKRVLTTLGRSMQVNQAMLVAIVVVLFITNCFVLYLKVGKVLAALR